jgi:hypothetical protein
LPVNLAPMTYVGIPTPSLLFSAKSRRSPRWRNILDEGWCRPACDVLWHDLFLAVITLPNRPGFPTDSFGFLLHVKENTLVDQRGLVIADHVHCRFLRNLSALWARFHVHDARTRMDLGAGGHG